MLSGLCCPTWELKCFLGGIWKKLKHLVIHLVLHKWCSGLMRPESCFYDFIIAEIKRKRPHFCKTFGLSPFSAPMYICKIEQCVGWVNGRVFGALNTCKFIVIWSLSTRFSEKPIICCLLFEEPMVCQLLLSYLVSRSIKHPASPLPNESCWVLE